MLTGENGVGPLSLRCPARHSPHSEVGGEQPHGRCGLQFPHLSQPRPASPQGQRPPPERESPRTEPHSEGAADAALHRLRPRPPGSPQRGRAWTGTVVAAGDATACTRHAPLPASVSLPRTGVRPDLSRPRSPSSNPGPYLGSGSDCESERPGNPRPASCGWLRSGRRQRW